jgi:glyoxalase-like protein
MSLSIRQIVFAARDLSQKTAEFERGLGLEVGFRDPGVAEFGLENVLMPLGAQFLEVVSPTRANTAAGRHLDRHGDSAYMLILQTDDLVRDRARLERLGVRIVWQSQYPDISSVHLHPKDIGAAIVSLDQPVPPESWRWAGPDWQQHTPAQALRVVEVTVGGSDPAALARRWHEVLGTEPPVATRDTWRIAIDGGVLEFVRSIDGADRITGFGLVMNSPSCTLCGTQLRRIAKEPE